MASQEIAVAAATPMPVLANQLTDDKLIPLAKFDPSQQRQIQDVALGVDIRDSNAIMTFGAQMQRKLNGVLDDLLAGTSTEELGQAGELTVELSKGIRLMNLRRMKSEAEGADFVSRACSRLGKIPVIGAQISAIRHFQLMHTEIVKHLADIETKAGKEMGVLKATNAKLDALVDATDQNLRALEVQIAGGQQALLRAREAFKALKAEVEKSNDAIAFAQLRDLGEQINAFETRLLRMQIAFMDGILSIPEIRATQSVSRIEIMNILDTILFDLPRLKSAIIRVSALNRIGKASAASAAKRKLTREIAEIGQDALQQVYVQSKQSQGEGLADVEALSTACDKLLATISRGVEIDAENRAKRAEAERKLVGLKDKLMVGMQAGAEQLLAAS
jgi:uncharacterized protein YaaN involved in tellurite resistance